MLRLLGIITLGNIIFGDRRRHDSFLGCLLILPVLMFGGCSFGRREVKMKENTENRIWKGSASSLEIEKIHLKKKDHPPLPLGPF